MIALLKTASPELERDDIEVPDGYELIDGELVEQLPMSEEASWIGGQIFFKIAQFCDMHDLGRVYPPDTVIRCFPGQRPSIRKVDTAFIRKDRLNARPSRGDLRIAPDLAVEVVSPHDTVYDLDRKIEQYLEAGIRLIWIVNPASRTVLVYRLAGTVQRLTASDELDGEDVLPGFRCRLDSFLPPPLPTEPISDSGISE